MGRKEAAINLTFAKMLSARRFVSAIAVGLVSAGLIACGGGGTRQTSEPGALRIKGGGSGQYREPGLDNTIEEYGHEGRQEELAQAARDVHGYLVARVEKDWIAACSFVSRALREQLEGDAVLAKQAGSKSCAAILPTISVPLPGKTPRESTTMDAGSLRVKDAYGFLFFDTPAGAHKLIVVREGGVWKANGLFPTPLH